MTTPQNPDIERDACVFIRSIKISGFRGFEREEKVAFSTPNGNPGSGLTVVVGANNSGKSSILESLMAASRLGNNPTFSEDKRNLSTGQLVKIELENTLGEVRVIETIDGGGSSTNRSNEEILPAPGSVYILPSRRIFALSFNESNRDRGGYVESQQRLPPNRQVTSALSQRLYRINESPELKKRFNALLAELAGYQIDWFIEQNPQGQYYLKYAADGISHPSEGMGDGITSLLYLTDALFDADDGEVIVIDEPELSLHPAILKRLSRKFSQKSDTRQIILLTHSPIFIDWTSLKNGGSIIRSAKCGTHCSMFHLSQSTAATLARLSTDLNNPHVLGIDAKETFFLEDRIVLVEGQEDALLYPKVFDQVNIHPAGSIFGWGVGGAEKMKTIAHVLSELGYQRVVGILDQDRAQLVGELQRLFPNYLFCAIPAVDIRTKRSRPAIAEKTGLLDASYTIRSEYLSETKQMAGNIFSYMSANAVAE